MGYIEITYTPDELESGQCDSCGEHTLHIVKGTQQCADCIEQDNFMEMTMRGL